jgi:HK97 family phage prohead protease
MSREIERRAAVGEEVRSNEAEGKIVGYAAVFDSESENLGGFREVIRRTAFDRAIREKHDAVARAHHKSEFLLGRVSNGTLALVVDEVGLRYEVQMPNTTAGRDTMEYVKRGDIKHSSFAFMVPKGGDVWEKRSSDGLALREVIDVDLVDVAPVIGPAYEATVVSARALEDAKGEPAVVPEPGVPNEVNEARLRAAQ